MNTHLARTIRTLRTIRSQDSGYAMATALLVGIIGFAVTAVIVAMVLFTIRGSQRGSETVADRAVAEAGIDSAMAAIAQSSSSSELPCVIPKSDLTGRQGASYSVEIKYYSGDGVLLTPCPGFTTTPSYAIIRSKGETASAGQAGSTASRTMEAKVTLTPPGAVEVAVVAAAGPAAIRCPG